MRYFVELTQYRDGERMLVSPIPAFDYAHAEEMRVQLVDLPNVKRAVIIVRTHIHGVGMVKVDVDEFKYGLDDLHLLHDKIRSDMNSAKDKVRLAV